MKQKIVYTPDEKIRNMILEQMQETLRWAKKYVRLFGQNPKKYLMLAVHSSSLSFGFSNNPQTEFTDMGGYGTALNLSYDDNRFFDFFREILVLNGFQAITPKCDFFPHSVIHTEEWYAIELNEFLNLKSVKH